MEGSNFNLLSFSIQTIEPKSVKKYLCTIIDPYSIYGNIFSSTWDVRIISLRLGMWELFLFDLGHKLAECLTPLYVGGYVFHPFLFFGFCRNWLMLMFLVSYLALNIFEYLLSFCGVCVKLQKASSVSVKVRTSNGHLDRRQEKDPIAMAIVRA